MAGNPEAIAAVCREISSGAIEHARQIISSDYPFFSFTNAGRQYSARQKTRVFIRDGFIDRYSGDKLVFPGVLRLSQIFH